MIDNPDVRYRKSHLSSASGYHLTANRKYDVDPIEADFSSEVDMLAYLDALFALSDVLNVKVVHTQTYIRK